MSDCAHTFAGRHGCPHCGATARTVQIDRFESQERTDKARLEALRQCDEEGHIGTFNSNLCVRCGRLTQEQDDPYVDWSQATYDPDVPF